MGDIIEELDHRVSELKTQSLKFGPQFALNIPDAEDVKNTFSHMSKLINTSYVTRNDGNLLHFFSCCLDAAAERVGLRPYIDEENVR